MACQPGVIVCDWADPGSPREEPPSRTASRPPAGLRPRLPGGAIGTARVVGRTSDFAEKSALLSRQACLE